MTAITDTVRSRALLTLVYVLLLCADPVSAGDRIDSVVDQAIGRMTSRLTDPITVSVGPLYYGPESIGSPFSPYLAGKLRGSLQTREGVRVFRPELLEQILAAAELSMTDLVAADTRVEVGRLAGVQAILTGRFFEAGEEVEVALELTSVETGTTISQADFRLRRADIPEGVAIVPSNYNDAIGVLEELSQIGSGADVGLEVRLWTARGHGATYRDGEKLVINVFASRDCHLKIYHVDVNKKVQLIFPNQFYDDSFVRGRTIYRIPDGRYPFDFVLGEPYGTEFIKVVASTVPFRDVEESFQPLGNAARELLTRGLTVTQREGQLAEAITSYTIVD